jgi:hypothetical protein
MLLRASFCTVLSLTAGLPAQMPSTSPPAAPGGAAPARTAQQQVETLFAAVRRGDAVALWDWLPAGHQRDVEALVHELAERVDARTYDRAAKLLLRLADTALAQEPFVFGNAAVGELLRQHGADARGAREAWAAGWRLLRQLATSELGAVDGLREFDGRAFTRRAGADLLAAVVAVARAQGSDPLHELDRVQVRTLGQRGGEVQIELHAPDRDAEVTTFVLVEDRWLPAAMAGDWRRGVQALRTRLLALPRGGDARTAAQAGLVLGMLEGLVRRFEDVESQADFDALVGELLARARGDAPRRR